MDKRFLYIEVRNVATSADEGVIVSFDAVEVMATNEDEVYSAGWAAILQQRATQGDPHNHGAGELLNDWVYEIV